MRQSAKHQTKRCVGLVNCSLNESLDRSSQQSTMNQAEDYQSYVTVNESNESLKRSFECLVYVNRVNRFSKINRLHAPTVLSGNGPWMNMKNSPPMVTVSLFSDATCSNDNKTSSGGWGTQISNVVTVCCCSLTERAITAGLNWEQWIYSCNSQRTELVKCYIWSKVSYGDDTWELRQDNRKYLESYEMWC